MAADIFAGAICSARRACADRLVAQVPADVCGEFGGRGVTPRAVLLQGLERDGVGIAAQLPGQRRGIGAAILRRNGGVAAQRAQLCARARRILLAQSAQHFIIGKLLEIQRQRAYQQLIEHDTERVDVGACVDVLARRVGLLRAHVAERADHGAHARVHGFRGELLRSRFGHAEVDNARHRLAVDFSDEDVRGLQVAVDDGLLVRVLHAFADLDEELHAAGAR